MDWIFYPDAWAAFVTLTILEIVLGIDNLVFLSIVKQKLPEHQRARARTIGLMLALVGRIALLLSIAWVMGLTDPLFVVAGKALSGRDLVLLFGGLFLIYKATREIHEETTDRKSKLAVDGRSSRLSGRILGQHPPPLTLGGFFPSNPSRTESNTLRTLTLRSVGRLRLLASRGDTR